MILSLRLSVECWNLNLGASAIAIFSLSSYILTHWRDSSVDHGCYCKARAVATVAVHLHQGDVLGAKMLGKSWGSCSQVKSSKIIWSELGEENLVKVFPWGAVTSRHTLDHHSLSFPLGLPFIFNLAMWDWSDVITPDLCLLLQHQSWLVSHLSPAVEAARQGCGLCRRAAERFALRLVSVPAWKENATRLLWAWPGDNAACVPLVLR